MKKLALARLAPFLLALAGLFAGLPDRPAAAAPSADWVYKTWIGTMDAKKELGPGSELHLKLDVAKDGPFQLTLFGHAPKQGLLHAQLLTIKGKAAVKGNKLATTGLTCIEAAEGKKVKCDPFSVTLKGENLIVRSDGVEAKLDAFDEARWKALESKKD